MIRVGNIKKGDHLCYLLFSESSHRTYIGYTNDIIKRLEAHNGKRSGGAKYTRMCGPWRLALIVSGFKNKIDALRFEWAAKHARKRANGRKMRVENFFIVFQKKMIEYPLSIHSFLASKYIKKEDILSLPYYVTFYKE